MTNVPPVKPIEITKREIWKEVQKDSFLLLLAKTFGAQEITINGKRWKNEVLRKMQD